MTAPDFTQARYREILRAGQAAGYRFAGFTEMDVLRRSGERACLLRHDCDNDLVAAVQMSELEAEQGVRSTYFVMLRSALYNVLAPPCSALVRRILAQGHWLGLHFDDFVVDGESDETLGELVDRERELVHREFGQPIEVVSFHQPSARVLEGRIRLHCINTYDRGDMTGVHYTSDSNLRFRGGEPSVLFGTADHSLIQLLIHPEWWTDVPMTLDQKWDGMLANNLELMQNSLLQREDTFTERRRWSLTPTEGRR